jgi:hypothetical protein
VPEPLQTAGAAKTQGRSHGSRRNCQSSACLPTYHVVGTACRPRECGQVIYCAVRKLNLHKDPAMSSTHSHRPRASRPARVQREEIHATAAETASIATTDASARPQKFSAPSQAQQGDTPAASGATARAPERMREHAGLRPRAQASRAPHCRPTTHRVLAIHDPGLLESIAAAVPDQQPHSEQQSQCHAHAASHEGSWLQSRGKKKKRNIRQTPRVSRG